MDKAILDKIIEATYDKIAEVQHANFEDVLSQFITNINNIQLDTIPEFTPCGKKLYLTRPKMREEIRKKISANLKLQFFKEIGHYEYDYINGSNRLKFEDKLEEAIKILTKKQQGK
jgi:hypothetical protein